MDESPEKWCGVKRRGELIEDLEGARERESRVWLAARHKVLNYTVQASQE